jgi:uncharacterized protein (TIGR02611 family)
LFCSFEDAGEVSDKTHVVKGIVRASLRQARRVIVFVIGATVLLIGVAMIALPGPAVVVIPLGLGILALEFVWAQRWLKKVRVMAKNTAQRFNNRRRPPAGTQGDIG